MLSTIGEEIEVIGAAHRHHEGSMFLGAHYLLGQSILVHAWATSKGTKAFPVNSLDQMLCVLGMVGVHFQKEGSNQGQ